MRTGKISKRLEESLSRDPYILCICEGAAEKAILDILMNHNMLRFTRKDLVENEVTLIRKARNVEERFLNRDYGERGLVIFRILDSRKENFKLRKQYADQYEVFNFYTRPEIEILHIIAEGSLENFKKSGEKPSTYFKELKSWKNSRIKTEEFVKSFYKDEALLLQTIMEYNSKCGQKDELNLSDLLTEASISRWNRK